MGFVRLDLAPDEARRVTFTVDATQLAHTGIDRRFVVDLGDADWFIGFDADDRRASGRFTVTGPVRALASADRVFFSETETNHV
jgi:hypothetical protein